MFEKIKNNAKKSIAIAGGLSLVGVAGLIKVISDEAQEWYGIMKKAEPQKIEREVGINRIELKRDSLLNELNKLEIEEQAATGAK